MNQTTLQLVSARIEGEPAEPVVVIQVDHAGSTLIFTYTEEEVTRFIACIQETLSAARAFAHQGIGMLQ